MPWAKPRRQKYAPPALDVVCGARFHLTKITWKVVHDSRRYYFCGSKCKRRFERDPAPFLSPGRVEKESS